MSESDPLPESCSENETPKSDISSSQLIKELVKDIPEVLKYIKQLEKQIKKQKKKLKKLRSKLKSKRKVCDVEIQTESTYPSNNHTVKEAKSLAEDIKEAAELATQNSGFIFDESSGLYYDSNTGYYYNAEYGLYYEASTGTYMTYKQETNTYEFHSQVQIPRPENSTERKRVKKRSIKTKDELKAKHSRVEADDDAHYETEEGECSQSSQSESEETNSDNSDVAKRWPPCMRIIVEQTKTPKIKMGSLYILTYEGGTLGREGSHAILLPDINISKCHLKFEFTKNSNCYFATDMGSRNGTIINGKRMSSAKVESEPFEVVHGTRIQIGSLILLCHIHSGNQTCGHCEPGLIQVPEKKEIEVSSAPSKSDNHKHELKQLRKKFGVSGYEEPNVKLASGYTDRAQHRRKTVGSQNPHEKTEVASVNESISSGNKGFKMLAKMGWKEGDSLGKDNAGITEPVPIISNPGTSGIGHAKPIVLDHPEVLDKNKQIIWKKAQDRFKKLPLAPSVFEIESD